MTTKAKTITYGQVRPAMTVTTYSGEEIFVTAVRNMVRLVDEVWRPAVELAGELASGGFVEHCYQSPTGRTRLIRDHLHGRSAMDDVVAVRSLHDYARRFTTLDLDLWIDVDYATTELL